MYFEGIDKYIFAIMLRFVYKDGVLNPESSCVRVFFGNVRVELCLPFCIGQGSPGCVGKTHHSNGNYLLLLLLRDNGPGQICPPTSSFSSTFLVIFPLNSCSTLDIEYTAVSFSCPHST